MAGIGNISAVSSLFVGLGAHCIGTALTDQEYATADFITILNGIKKLGNILDGSTSYSGTEAATEDWKNAQGVTITSTVTDAGSIGYTFSIQDFTPELKALLFGATDIAVTGKPSWAETANPESGTAQGWVAAKPIIRPLVFFDETMTKVLVIPKAKIIASLGMDGNKHVIAVNATAEMLDTAKLKTIMSYDIPAGVQA